MAEAKVRVDLDDAAFLRLNYPTGHVGRFTNALTASIVTLARVRVPSRTGRLRDSIKMEVTQRSIGGVTMRVSANTLYANFVHEGTRGHVGEMTLYSPRGPYGDRRRDAAAAHAPGGSRLPWVGAKVFVVSGQRANPFLRTAARDSKRLMVH